MLEQRTRRLTRAQTEAIRRAMQTFIEDDLAFGVGSAAPRWCDRCTMQRPGAGFVDYDAANLCNDCAIAYEIARTSGTTGSVTEFLITRVA